MILVVFKIMSIIIIMIMMIIMIMIMVFITINMINNNRPAGAQGDAHPFLFLRPGRIADSFAS